MSSSGLKIGWINSTSLLAILRLPFGCLERFSIIMYRDHGTWYHFDWNHFNGELKDALSNIIHSSTLKTLSLTGITRVPTTFFLHIVHLSTLELHSISLNDFCDKNSSSLTRAASMEVTPVASHTVIDRCVWHFREEVVCGTRFPSSAYFSLIQDREGLKESKFLPFMCRLRFFKIYIDVGSPLIFDFWTLSLLMGSLCISLTSPATLEHLEFNIRFCGSGDDFDLKFYYDLCHADFWSHLDSIASHPTGSRLQRVDINIDCSYCYYDSRYKPDKDKTERLSLMVYLYFVRKAFCSSKPL
jgi:hypothetical protein